MEKLVTDSKAARERARQDAVYQGAVSRFNSGAFEQALSEFRSITKYKDVEDWIKICQKRIDEQEAKKERNRKKSLYEAAQTLADQGTYESLINASQQFEKLGNFEDALEKAADCSNRAERIQKMRFSSSLMN